MSFEPDSDDSFAYPDGVSEVDAAESISDSTDPSWEDIMYHEPIDDTNVSLTGSDVVALSIAAVQTVFLPLVILMIFLLAMGLFLSIFF
ncbi:MAG: hypothetical protein K9W43_04675 [Candidatus Thorarchaeota archaeon]|nr:hypothetical protein [Candidatus Thorarchaeota archaeon]